MKRVAAILIGIGGVSFVAALAFVVSSFFHGLALSMLWGWFIVPTFGAPGLTLAQAMGVAVTVGFMTKNYTPTQEGVSPGHAIGESVMAIAGWPLMAIACGWVLQAVI